MTEATPHRMFQATPAGHTIILASGDKVRHWQVRSWVLAAGTAVSALALLASLGAVTLFTLSDDVAARFSARQAETVAGYEQRISVLRLELDRMKTRQHSDREIVRTKVDELISQQKELTTRFAQLAPLLEGPSASSAAAVPLPVARPSVDALAPSAHAYAEESLPSNVFTQFDTAPQSTAGVARPWREGAVAAEASEYDLRALAADVLPSFTRSMEDIEKAQTQGVTRLIDETRGRALEISELFDDEGFELPAAAEDAFSGGPFVPVPDDASFELRMAELGEALDALRTLNAAAERLPLGRPVSDAPTSSRFGVRKDPFLGRNALHTGIDFAAKPGSPVQAVAAGRVVHAGRRGGYGKMVEIDHGNGFMTRYAHLSSIATTRGAQVELHDPIGAVGSTGRSTGPHLHYEVRRAGAAVDPTRYLQAGERLRSLL